MRFGKRLAPYLLLTLGVCLAFGSTLLQSHILQIRDHRAIFWGRWWWVQESLRSFTLPTRTLASNTNVPLESLLNGTYTPMTFIFLFFDHEVAYDLFVAGHVLLGCVGIFVLARSLGASRDGALVASAFGLAGPVLSFENLLVGLQGITWIPWTLFAVHRFIVTRRIAWVGGLAFFAGFHLQGVMPETAFLDLIAGVLLIVYTRSTGVRIDIRILGGLLFGGALAVAICAVELMPVLEGLAGTTRGDGFTALEASVWPVNPIQLLEVWLPVFFHSPDQPFVQFPKLIGRQNHTPYLYSLYLGAALQMSFLSVLSKDRDTRRFSVALATLAIVMLLIAVGPALPFYGWIHELPVLRNGRYPMKFMVLVTAALAALAPAGYETLRTRGRLTSVVFVPAAVVAVAVLRLLPMPEVRASIASNLEMDPAPGAAFGFSPETYVDHAIQTMNQSALHVLVIALGLLIVSVVARRVPLLWPLIVWIIIVDFSVAARREIVRVPASPPPPSELVDRLASPHHRYYSVSPGLRFASVKVHDDETPMEAQLRDAHARGENIVGYARLFDDQNNDAQSHPASTLAYRVVQRARGRTAFRLLARAGVRHVASYAKPPSVEATRFEIEGGAPQWVFGIPGVRDYVMIHSRHRNVSVSELGTRPVLKALTDAANRDVAFVTSGPLPATTVETSTQARVCRSGSTATLIEGDDLNRIEIDVDLSCASIVSVLEVHMPRWRVSIDGVSAPIHDVDFGFLAAQVPEGRHKIVFEYVSSTSRWAWLSFAAALVALLLIVIQRTSRRTMDRSQVEVVGRPNRYGTYDERR